MNWRNAVIVTALMVTWGCLTAVLAWPAWTATVGAALIGCVTARPFPIFGGRR